MRKTAVLPILTVLFVFISITLHGFVLKDVKFEGLKTIQKNELTYAYSAYIGKDINMYAIEDIVSQLEELGYFEDIQYVLEDVPGKENEKILLIKVVENEPVSQVSLEITGPGIIAKETLQGSITLQEGKAFSFEKFWESINNIAKIYTDNGYIVATPKSQDKTFAFVYISGRIDGSNVLFKVTEYVLYDVKFEIQSNDEQFKSEFQNIEKQLSLPKYKDYEVKAPLLRIFDSPKNYVPTLQKFQEFFQNLSKYVYFKVIDISTFEEEIDIPAKSLVITLTDNTIVNQPAQLKGIRTKGNTIFSERELVGEVKEGTYTNFEILKTIQKVKDKYDKSGYIVNLNLETDKEGYLYIVVSETKVRNVKITGNERTKTYVFDDLIAVKPGDYLNRNQLQVTYIELKKSNFFKDVNLNFEPVDNDSVDIVVNVLEKDKKFDFQGGITWGPVKDKPWYEGFAGILSLSSTNPFGYGENFSISLQKALSTTNLSLNFGIRKPFEMPLSVSSSISFNQETQEGTTTTKWSTSAGISTLKMPIGQFSLTANYSETTTSSTTTLTTKTLALTGSYVYETLDNLYVPMKGYSFTFSGTKYFPLSEQGSDAVSYFTEATYHLPLSETVSLASRIYNAQVFQTAGAPVNFSLAGPYQVRGVKSEEKGTVLVLNNNEIRFKEPDQIFYFSIFYDLGFIGQAYTFDNLKSSAGVELGLVLPMFGLVRFGVGLQILPTFSPNFNTYFIFGQTF
ncbi:POTRA domain-containing protein [Fervidobacterium pennivorans subsp. shakshaketiis]|uniref:Outer membrane protein/protective antigen OMA87 n=1 Tax=Fervidobacterium pennivorans (strain DSM 9078 / Ven5) TaxID=771875 RepID=H9UC75_FERPD|nr:POTRA domain-containing protein [Fervidobacterium pennivorans]AFG35118.1 outer membrane protein/protective antigen OMA87 [Fervidobacterium pennivorans DSM 9078]